MRLRSILAVLLLTIAGVGTLGCGSSSDQSFVATGNAAGPPITGDLVFNFNQGDNPFNVDPATAELLFEFFDGVGGEPVYVQTRDFAGTVTIEDVPGTVRAFRITGYDANDIPLFTIDQTVNVVVGDETVVSGISTPVAVTLQRLRLAPGNVFDLGSELTSVQVQNGGSAQVFLFGEYSDGSFVLLDEAAYSIPASGAGIASVNELGRVTGISQGVTTLLAQYGGQTLSVPVVVGDGSDQQLSGIAVTNQQPVELTPGNPVQITTTGTRASDNAQFGLAPSSLNYEFDAPEIADGFSVDANGQVSVDQTVADGATATLLVSWTNPDQTQVTQQVSVQASNP